MKNSPKDKKKKSKIDVLFGIANMEKVFYQRNTVVEICKKAKNFLLNSLLKNRTMVRIGHIYAKYQIVSLCVYAFTKHQNSGYSLGEAKRHI